MRISNSFTVEVGEFTFISSPSFVGVGYVGSSAKIERKVEKMRGIQSVVWCISYISIPMDKTFPLLALTFTLGDDYSKLGLFSFQLLNFWMLTLESNRKSRHFW